MYDIAFKGQPLPESEVKCLQRLAGDEPGTPRDLSKLIGFLTLSRGEW
jgi:hypothetical protein